MIDNYPSRIVCLTDETTEILYLLAKASAWWASRDTQSVRQSAREKPKEKRERKLLSPVLLSQIHFVKAGDGALADVPPGPIALTTA